MVSQTRQIKLYCEMCGSPTPNTITVIIEGSKLNICNSCYLKVKKNAKVVEDVPLKKIGNERALKRPQISKKGNVNSAKRASVAEDYEIDENYSTIIKEARERLGYTPKELADKLKTQENVIRRFETGKLRPTIEQARTLEKILKVKLIVPLSSDVELENQENNGLTLGDIANIKVRKQ